MCDTYIRQGQAYSWHKPIFSSESTLHQGYDRKSSVEKKISGREPQGAWRQDEL
jgi:hypothetical protein